MEDMQVPKYPTYLPCLEIQSTVITKPVYTTIRYISAQSFTMPNSNETPSDRVLRELGKQSTSTEEKLNNLMRVARHPDNYGVSYFELKEIREAIKNYQHLLESP